MNDRAPSAFASVLVASHPRSGTHLVIDLLRRQFMSTRSWRFWGLPTDHLYLNLERTTSTTRHFGGRLAGAILSRTPRPIMKTHYLRDFSETWIGGETGPIPTELQPMVDRATKLYVVRDPRDVMVSYLQFMSGIDPSLATLSLRAFMDSPHWTGRDTRLSWWRRHVDGWRAHQDAIILKYEDVVRDPDRILMRLEHALDEPSRRRQPALPPKRGSISRARIDRVLSLAPPSTAIIADAKRFPARRWQDCLTRDDHRAIEAAIGPTLDALGYATHS